MRNLPFSCGSRLCGSSGAARTCPAAEKARAAHRPQATALAPPGCKPWRCQCGVLSRAAALGHLRLLQGPTPGPPPTGPRRRPGLQPLRSGPPGALDRSSRPRDAQGRNTSATRRR
eukprot:1463239-Lingulodinium_polyedra.AAC.1